MFGNALSLDGVRSGSDDTVSTVKSSWNSGDALAAVGATGAAEDLGRLGGACFHGCFDRGGGGQRGGEEAEDGGCSHGGWLIKYFPWGAVVGVIIFFGVYV